METYFSENYAVTVRNLTKSFGETKALGGVSFDVRKGEIFSLLGINGAGKTTAIRILTGLLKADSGSAQICGYRAGSPEAARLLGYSPQENALAMHLTAEENLLLMADLYGVESASAHTEEMLLRLGLEEHRKKRAKMLSGGLQRRLSIGMALIGKPRILLLDEPTLGLDVLARRNLHTFIRSLQKERNMAVLLTTHYMEEAQLLSDRIGVLVNGRLCAAGTFAELCGLADADTDARLEDVFIRLAQKEEAR
ncbi:MAG: ABC transporter ATP-binding protein [Clostridia bacterium]|nr:ABC transporter ATP-binding protein [Clostridia bacterium]